MIGSLLHAAQSPKDDQPVELSAYEVTAERIDFNKWIKVTSPHFVIYTDASVKETRQLAKRLEMIQEAVQFYFRRGLRKAPPLLVILPTTQSDWQKVKSTGVEWKASSELLTKSRSMLVLQVDWQEDPGYVFMPVGAHGCELMNIEGPLWFSTGLHAFFFTITFEGDSLKIGMKSEWTTDVSRLGFMDWNRFFTLAESSPDYFADTDRHRRFNGQATAFIHYLLTNQDKTCTTKLLRWSALCEGKDKPSEEDFQSVFGQKFDEMERSMRRFQEGGRYTSNSISFPPEALKFDIQNESVSPKEMRELFVIAQATLQKTPSSLAAIDSILRHGLQNEDLREQFADCCLSRGRRADALAQYRLLIEHRSTNPGVYEEAASIEMHGETAEQNIDHHLGAEGVEVEKWARYAVELDPLFFEGYNTLAWVLASKAEVKPTDIETINQICHALSGKDPTDQPLAALAVAYWRSGDIAKAQKINKLLMESPYTRKRTRKIAEALLKHLNEAPSSK